MVAVCLLSRVRDLSLPGRGYVDFVCLFRLSLGRKYCVAIAAIPMVAVIADAVSRSFSRS